MDAVNTWVEPTHIHAKMRQVLEQKIKLTANSVHKETTKGAKGLHNRHVKSLVSKLNDYRVDPFEGVVKELSTGKEIDIEIITDMINADVVGNELFKMFVKERFVDGSHNLFDPIKRCDLKTGLKKQHKFVFFLHFVFVFCCCLNHH